MVLLSTSFSMLQDQQNALLTILQISKAPCLAHSPNCAGRLQASWVFEDTYYCSCVCPLSDLINAFSSELRVTILIPLVCVKYCFDSIQSKQVIITQIA